MSDEAPLDPAAERVVGKLKRLILVSGLFTTLAIATVFGVIGYRLFRAEGSLAEQTATLPRGARVVAVAVGDGRLAVTVDVAGATEIRLYDLKTLKATGRLGFAAAP